MIELTCRRALRCVALAFSALLFACGGGEPAPQDGSETHFLVVCGGGCPAGLECQCGVCSRPCTEASTCSPLESGASCVASGPRIAEQRCADETASSICDLPCLVDVDCSAVDETRACQAGFCRPKTGGPPELDPKTCAPPAFSSNDLVVLGDSFISLSVFVARLEAHAVTAGALATAEHFRGYASHLTSFIADNSLSISSEYDTARSEGPPRIVVMDGGATDMLNNPCPSGATPTCPAVDAAARGAELLLQRMAEDGVEHVFYFFYPDPVGDANLEGGLNALRPLIENACGKSPLACHWLDLRPVYAGHYAEYAGADGFVPSNAGADASALALWQLMQARCVVP